MEGKIIAVCCLVLLCVFYAVSSDNQDTYVPQERFSEVIDETFPLDAAGSFTVANRYGSIEVTAWDRDEVHVVAEKEMRLGGGEMALFRLFGIQSADVESQADAEALFEAFAIETSGDARALTLETNQPRAEGVRFIMEYRITVPRQVNLTATTRNGSVSVEDIRGAVAAHTTNGQIEAGDIEGSIKARSTNGRITLEAVSGGIDARLTNGRIELELADQPGLTGPVRCRTTNGSIRVEVPESAGFEFEAAYTDGRLRSDIEEIRDAADGSRRNARATVGEGGPLVELETVNGSIRINRS